MTPTERADTITGCLCFVLCWVLFTILACVKLWDHDLTMAVIAVVAAAICDRQAGRMAEQLSASQR